MLTSCWPGVFGVVVVVLNVVMGLVLPLALASLAAPVATLDRIARVANILPGHERLDGWRSVFLNVCATSVGGQSARGA